VLISPAALASDCPCLMKVNVMLRACGDPPPQAPTIIAAVSTAAAFKAFLVMLRVDMGIDMGSSLPCERSCGKCFAMVAFRKDSKGDTHGH